MKKTASFGILAIMAGLLVFFVLPLTDGYQTEKAAADVFDNVITGNYAQAAEHVYFFDRATDQEPTITQENGKSKWINRIRILDAEGTSLVGYKNLRIERDDAILKATVDLVLDVHGTTVVKEDVHIVFTDKGGEWQIQYIEHLGVDKEEEWEQALGGHITSE